MTTIGFIGLGKMGAAMATRLLESGQDVLVWNRSPEPVARLAAAGASVAMSAAEALAAEVSISMLSDDAATEEVLSTPAAGGLHINMASVSPDATDRLEALFSGAGARFVAAPVLGRWTAAAAGQLHILMAGSDDAVRDAEPYLAPLAARVWRMGLRPRVANVAKVVVNYNLIHAIQSLGESIAIVERQGINPADFVALLTNTMFGGTGYAVYGQAIAERSYHPAGFHMALGFKDLALVEGLAADSHVELPTAPALRRVFEKALSDSTLANSDWAAIAEVTRRVLNQSSPLD